MFKYLIVLACILFIFALNSIGAQENKIEVEDLDKRFGDSFDIELSEGWLIFKSKKK